MPEIIRRARKPVSQNRKLSSRQPPKKEPPAKPEKVNPLETIPGKAEAVVKITRVPKVREVKHRWVRFHADIGDTNSSIRYIRVTFRPKVFNKIVRAQDQYPFWVAVVNGSIGERIPKGFLLDNPGANIFERKPREGEGALPGKPEIVIKKWERDPHFKQVIQEETVPALCDILVKICDIPIAIEVENNWKQFDVQLEGTECKARYIRITVRPKVFNKIVAAHEKFDSWVAVIQGKIGEKIPGGFILDSPGVNVFERQARKSELQ